jgi:transcriptional regulator with XRE-family HTH domain
MSQSDFAAKIGIKQTSYSSWERGIKDPSAQTVALIASTFGVSSDWLLGLAGGAPPTPAVDRTPELKLAILKVLNTF